jgi:hypothetical protein
VVKTQWCREHIEKVQTECGLKTRTVQEHRQARDFCKLHPELNPLSTKAVIEVVHAPHEKHDEIVAEIVPLLDADEEVTAKVASVICARVIRGLQSKSEEGEKPAEASEQESDDSSMASGGIPRTGSEPEQKPEPVQRVQPQRTPTTFAGLLKYLRVNYHDREVEVVGKVLEFLKSMEAP